MPWSTNPEETARGLEGMEKARQAVLRPLEMILGTEVAEKALTAFQEAVGAMAWAEGAGTALNHAICNDDGVTLRLTHTDDRPWLNPHTGVPWADPT